jgi:FkbM family methyltransferase
MIEFKNRHKIISYLGDINVIGIRGFVLKVLPKLLIPKPKPGSFFIKTIYNFKIKIEPIKDNGIERSLYYTGTYEKGSLDVLKNVLKKGDVFIDVGANIGMMSLFASEIVGDNGKVICFEPNPITRAILIENIQENNFKNIEVSHYAIGSKSENATIYDRWDTNRGSATLIKPEFETESYDVSVIKLSEYDLNSKKIAMIKIDVEGYELEVLKGIEDIISSENAPMLMVEYSDLRINKNDGNTYEIYDFIKNSNSYRFFKNEGSKSRVSKLIEIFGHQDLPNHDNIYCFLDKHISEIPTNIFK